MAPATALLQPAGAQGAQASTSGRPLAPLAPQQPPSPCPGGRRRRPAPPVLRAQSVGYEGRQAAAAPSGTARPFGVPPGSFVQQRGPPVVPQRSPSPPPPGLQSVQQQQAMTAAALAAQRQAQQAALLAAQQQQQQASQQQVPPALRQVKQQQQKPPGPPPAPAAAQQAAPVGPAAAAQQAPMPPETLAAINKAVDNARKANARAAAAAQAGDVDEQERRRRLKISQANKGRTPWNKGRRHSPETIARIRAATKVAMQRADVRERLQKANEKRVPHSTEAKVGAGAGCRGLWCWVLGWAWRGGRRQRLGGSWLTAQAAVVGCCPGPLKRGSSLHRTAAFSCGHPFQHFNGAMFD